MNTENPIKYDAAYFIAKFAAIPEEKWTTGEFINERGQCCAYGHCGDRIGEFGDEMETEEGCRLGDLSEKHLGYRSELASINDRPERRYPQPTPKQRVLAWLRDAQEAGL